uniref:dCTP pyrophosphatase 1 n=1 Tax=Leptobrachium leishanense TaxID=445787 RepID=A0A8C5N1T2_9ANUR
MPFSCEAGTHCCSVTSGKECMMGTFGLLCPGEVVLCPRLFSMSSRRCLQAQFTRERNWNQFHQPRNLLLALVGEVGEVSELFQWQGEVAEGLPGWSAPQREALSHELSDVLIYLLELAEKCRVDLPQAVLAKMELNAKKYPASRVQGSAKKYTEYTCEKGASSAEPDA